MSLTKKSSETKHICLCMCVSLFLSSITSYLLGGQTVYIVHPGCSGLPHFILFFFFLSICGGVIYTAVENIFIALFDKRPWLLT